MPSLKNLLVYPDAHVQSRPKGNGSAVTLAKVDGLLCYSL